jgi:hypothetical protein
MRLLVLLAFLTASSANAAEKGAKPFLLRFEQLTDLSVEEYFNKPPGTRGCDSRWMVVHLPSGRWERNRCYRALLLSPPHDPTPLPTDGTGTLTPSQVDQLRGAYGALSARSLSCDRETPKQTGPSLVLKAGTRGEAWLYAGQRPDCDHPQPQRVVEGLERLLDLMLRSSEAQR